MYYFMRINQIHALVLDFVCNEPYSFSNAHAQPSNNFMFIHWVNTIGPKI